MDVVVIDPVILQSCNFKPFPENVFDVPLTLTIPPAAWVNVPEPEVDKFPAMFNVVVAGAVIPDPEKERL